MQVTSTNLATIQFSEFTDSVERNWVSHQQLVQPMARQLYIVGDMGYHEGDTKVYDEWDGETFADDMPEGTNAKKASVGTGYEKQGTVERFGKEVDITWHMRRLNKKPQVIGELTSLFNFIPQREELDLSHRITFGTSTSYTNKNGRSVDVSMGDGFALFYSAHTLANSSATYRNRIVGDPLFSTGAYEAAQKLAVTDVLSNLGERRVLDFSIVWSTDNPTLCNEITRVLKSTSDPDQDNSSVVNPHMGKKTHIKLPYLATTATGARDSTKEQWWGICAPGMAGWQAYLDIVEPATLKLPVAGGNGEDIHNDVWTYGVRGARILCVVSGKGNIASCPVS